MNIDKMCEDYERETDLIKKSNLAKEIVLYCEEHPDEDVPNMAKDVYVKYLLGYEQ